MATVDGMVFTDDAAPPAELSPEMAGDRSPSEAARPPSGALQPMTSSDTSRELGTSGAGVWTADCRSAHVQ